MKFGLEIEKFLFDQKSNRPSEGSFQFIDALSDFDSVPESLRHVTNEFVLSMIEIVTSPSDSPIEVIKDYILNYLILNSVAQREAVATVGLGSLPMDYCPHMVPKWSYFFQNSVLNKSMKPSWILTKDSVLSAAGNCAGIHIHTEIETLPEHLYSNRELVNKFNMGLMLTPMIAFSSSPYFFGEHEASSMRGYRYFGGVYKDFPMNGGLPDVMESSEEVLHFFKASADQWLAEGLSIGLPVADFSKQVNRKGANWNPIRWNRTWNTIEVRCLDSDRIDLDCAKFIWVTSVMRRMDLKGENLSCRIIDHNKKIDRNMVDECFNVEDGIVSILPTHALKDIFYRAIKFGVKDELVSRYLKRLADFAKINVDSNCLELFRTLEKVLENQATTSEVLLKKFHPFKLNEQDAISIVTHSIELENKVLRRLIQQFPETSKEWGNLLFH